MAEKNLKTRIILKHDTEENWNKASSFIPKSGEIIVYQYNESPHNRIKIGNGVDVVGDLPFLDEILSEYAPINSPVFTGVPKAPTLNVEDYDNTDSNNRAQLATCGFVYDLIYYLLGTNVDEDSSSDSAALTLGLYDVASNGNATLNSFNSSVDNESHTLVLT